MATSFAGLKSLDPSNFLGSRPDVGSMIQGQDNARFAGEIAGLQNAADMASALKDMALNKKKSNLSKSFGAHIQGSIDLAETMGGLSVLLQIGATLAGSGAFGGGMDPVGTQGNPFGNVGADSPILGIPGGAAVGGGRIPLGGG